RPPALRGARGRQAGAGRRGGRVSPGAARRRDAVGLTSGWRAPHVHRSVTHHSDPTHPLIAPSKPSEPLIVVRDDAPGVTRFNGAVAAIGNFDGVHRGHRAVIDAAVTRATSLGAPAIAVTFEPHPRKVLRPSDPIFRLTDETSK